MVGVGLPLNAVSSMWGADACAMAAAEADGGTAAGAVEIGIVVGEACASNGDGPRRARLAGGGAAFSKDSGWRDGDRDLGPHLDVGLDDM